MTQEPIDWDKDLSAEPQEEYQALVRSLKRTQGFGLLFARCSPAEGERLIARVREDISQKKIEVLRLEEPIDKLYDIVEELSNKDQINVLFIKGLEYSLYEYEREKRLRGWKSQDIYSYSWKGVPRVLINLNQQRERFRDNFNICFVFLLPLFAIKYLIQRAPDFFDWRSGMFEFSTPEVVERKISRILSEKEYEAAFASYDQAVQLEPDDDAAWYNRGIALDELGRYEEAVASYDRALQLKPDNDAAWYNKACCYALQGNTELAIENLQKAIQLSPDKYREMAKADPDFDKIRYDERFQALIQEQSEQ